jgi:hypothetical protein
VKERTPTVVGLSVLLLAVAAVAALLFSPRSNKVALSTPDIGTDPGVGTSIRSHGPTGTQPVTGTTIGGIGPTFVTTTTSPFVLAGPTGQADASTTIPGVGPTFYTPPILQPTTTRQPVTTTTQQPFQQLAGPYTPAPASIRKFCGINKSVGSLASLLRSTQFDDQAVLTAVSTNLARYQQFAPPDAVAIMTALRSDFAQMVNLVAANGWKADSPGVLAVVASNSPPVSNIRNDDTIIQPIEDRVCGTS